MEWGHAPFAALNRGQIDPHIQMAHIYIPDDGMPQMTHIDIPDDVTSQSAEACIADSPAAGAGTAASGSGMAASHTTTGRLELKACIPAAGLPPPAPADAAQQGGRRWCSTRVLPLGTTAPARMAPPSRQRPWGCATRASGVQAGQRVWCAGVGPMCVGSTATNMHASAGAVVR